MRPKCVLSSTGKYRGTRLFVFTLGCSRKAVRVLESAGFEILEQGTPPLTLYYYACKAGDAGTNC